MDDIYQYRTNADSGIRFRSCIWESPHIPISMMKWGIQKYEPEVDWWVTLEQSRCSLEEALRIVPMRLEWWATNVNETE